MFGWTGGQQCSDASSYKVIEYYLDIGRDCSIQCQREHGQMNVVFYMHKKNKSVF